MRRLIQLYLGLALFGISDGFLVLAGLGLDPWDVFHQGLSHHSPIAIGTWSIIVGAAVLLLWIPLRQLPGLGTISNVILVGAMINVTLAAVPSPVGLVPRFATLIAAVVLNGIATGAYIGAGMGPGPRDGLMTGLAKRGWSIRVARTSIEITILVAGFLLGGSVGIGTVLYAVSIGPLSHYFIPLLTVPLPQQKVAAGVPAGTRKREEANSCSLNPACSSASGEQRRR